MGGSATLQAGGPFALHANRSVSLATVGAATVDTNGYGVSIAGSISGWGTLTKIGAGTLTLSGLNTYTGPTNVTAGALKLAAGVANNIASSTPINLDNGATLDVTGLSGGAITLASGQTLAGSGTVAGGVVAANGSHVAPGIGTLTMGR